MELGVADFKLFVTSIATVKRHYLVTFLMTAKTFLIASSGISVEICGDQSILGSQYYDFAKEILGSTMGSPLFTGLKCRVLIQVESGEVIS
jgi:hypothetical protein